MTNNTLPTGEVTEEQIEAGFRVLWRTEFASLADIPSAYKNTVRAIYLAMRNAATPEQDGLVWRLRLGGTRLASESADDAAVRRNRDMRAAADHIEAQAAQIAELRRERDEARERAGIEIERLIALAGSRVTPAEAKRARAALTNNGGEK